MKVGYVRVSTKEQNTARQEVLMQELGVEKVYIDKVSGKDTNRPALAEMMEFIRDGDVLVVESFSRFARNTRDLLRLVDQLKEKNVQFISKKEAVDTDTATGKFMLTIFGAVAELERETTLDRQREGIALAKAEGRYKGRQPKKIDEVLFADLYRQWKNDETSPKYMAKKLGISRNTFYRKVRDYEVKHGIKKEGE